MRSACWLVALIGVGAGWADAAPEGPPFYDPERSIAKQETAAKEAKAAGHRQHKLGKDPFQLGACFVFAPGNRDVFAHVSKTFGDNASVVKVLAALANLGRQGIKHSGADSNAREWDAAHPRDP